MDILYPQITSLYRPIIPIIALYYGLFFLQVQWPAPARSGYHCMYCGKSFSSSSNRIRHIKKHTDDRKYQCFICLKRFIQKDHYTGHMNAHAGAKPHQCHRCLQCFVYKSSLSNHLSKCKAVPIL